MNLLDTFLHKKNIYFYTAALKSTLKPCLKCLNETALNKISKTILASIRIIRHGPNNMSLYGYEFIPILKRKKKKMTFYFTEKHILFAIPIWVSHQPLLKLKLWMKIFKRKYNASIISSTFKEVTRRWHNERENKITLAIGQVIYFPTN